MKIQIIVLSLCILILSSVLTAQEMIPTPINKKVMETPVYKKFIPSDRTVPQFTFTRTPVSLLTSYYDFMIGSYNGMPVQVIPDNVTGGGGYFLTYHGRRYATGTRRMFYAYLDADGTVLVNNEITSVVNNEGYGTVAVDPVSGKPFYAWHCNADTDLEMEVQFTVDQFYEGIYGLFLDTETVIDNPITVSATTDNEFIWPTAVIGPSPFPNKRRIYIIARNSVTHTYGPSENPIIAYADFDENQIEEGIPFTWSYTSIPEMNQWNVDVQWRRPFHSLTADNAGNLYYAGFHFATEADGITAIIEPDVDVFKCGNYGQGTWTRISSWGNLPSWNPNSSPTDTTGWFKNPSNQPYGDNELSWELFSSASGHLNATVDDLGRIHFPAVWRIITNDGYWFPNLQLPKEIIFDPSLPEDSQFRINDIWPHINSTNHIDEHYQPWDNEPPWGEAEFVQDPYTGTWQPKIYKSWEFPYWDDTAHDNAMFFHCNNMKVTEGNGEGMLAMVWQNCARAKWYNADGDADYAAWANTPEIWISVSSDNGNHWSEPIKLNNIETPQFAGLKPMWVYPANKVKYVGMQGNRKVGKLGLMFYNDYTWGAYVISPGVGAVNDGGQVMFTELQIVFPSEEPQEDPFGQPIVLSSSMSVMAGVHIDGQMAAAGDVVAAFVNVNETPQLRGKETVQIINGIAGCLMQVYTETNGETVYFKVWDASTNRVLNITETLASQVNGVIGSWPDNLFWLNAVLTQPQNISLNAGWNMVSLNVHPNSMAITDIFSGIMGYVEMIKSPEGVFIPGNPHNTLTQLSDGKGVFVKVNSPCVLSVTGIPVDLTTPIYLSAGWNLIGYILPNPMNISSALISLAGNYIQVKGVEGVFEPNNPFSTLSVLSPGRAYWIKLINPGILFYAYPLKEEQAPQNILSCAKWGTPIQKTNSQAVLCSLGNFASVGDQLAALVNGELRGLAALISNNGILGTYINIFTDSPGEIIEFKLIKKNSQEIIQLQPNLSSEPGEITGDYSNGIYYTLTQAPNQTPEIVTGLVSAYPNPFSVSTSITLNVGKEKQPIQIEIYNLRGQKIITLVQDELESGQHNILWNGTDENGRRVASGVYLCKMHSKDRTQSIKLMVLK